MQRNDFIFAIVAVTILLTLFIGFIISLLLLFQKRKQRHLLDMANAKAEFSQTLLTAQNEIQEETLSHVSQELHDNISQKLGLAKLQLYSLQQSNNKEDIGEIKEVISAAISDIRELSRSLHPDRISSISLQESIGHEVEKLEKAGAFSVKTAIAADDDLSKEQRIILFRIVQELLNNAIKYSKASLLKISLSCTPCITLIVEDNGVGLPQDYKKGIGHTSIQNRVRLLKGEFVMESLAGYGTKAIVRLFPLS